MNEDINPEFVKEVCKGNAAAGDFLVLCINWFHAIDDLCDADQPGYQPNAPAYLRKQKEVEAFAQAILVLSNDFYLRNIAGLRMELLQIAQLYSLSLKWEERDEEWLRRWADTQRHAGAQMILAVATICGGWSHATAVAEKVYGEIALKNKAD